MLHMYSANDVIARTASEPEDRGGCIPSGPGSAEY